jgi:hypothetical protein
VVPDQFGFIVRAEDLPPGQEAGAYWVGAYYYNDWNAVIVAGPSFYDAFSSPVAKTPFDPGDDWHTYRAEVEGNTIRLFVDGTLLVEGIDNQYLERGRIGLFSVRTQINVRNFKTSAL